MLDLLPQPTRLTLAGAGWSFRPQRPGARTLRVTFRAEDPLAPQAELLATFLHEENHCLVEAAAGEGGDVHLALTRPARPLAPALAEAGFADEAHRLVVGPAGVRLEAASAAGVARGIQTLRQLLSGQRGRLELPGLEIEDEPAVGWRGLQLDVSRHFRDAADVRRFIDLAAFHKFNVFHWHLTDDQGWRLPIEGYPRLIEVAAWRDGTQVGHDNHPLTGPTDGRRHGGHYTLDEIRDIVDYAAVRGIHILPEVDVPGHVQALVTAYPELGNTGTAPGVAQHWGIRPSTLNLEPATFDFLERMVATLADLFPFAYLHFGGDEAMIDEWAASPRIAERCRELGLEGASSVQGHFTRFLAAAATRHGRRMIGWDEIIERDALPAGAAVMFWRDWHEAQPTAAFKALQAGRPVVLAPTRHTYFDYQQEDEPPERWPHLPLEKVYGWEPMAPYPPEWHGLILGAQAQLWTENIATRRHLDYMTYPRACALAQVLWTGATRELLAAFRHRLTAHLSRLDRLGVAYRPPTGG